MIIWVLPSQVPTTLPSPSFTCSFGTMSSVKTGTPFALIFASISDLTSSQRFTCERAGEAINIDAATAIRLFILIPPFAVKPPRNRIAPYMLPGSAVARCGTKNPPVGRVLWGVSSALGVAAQPVREFSERADAARFGAVAPVLQLPNELLAGGTRAFPQGRELRDRKSTRLNSS